MFSHVTSDFLTTFNNFTALIEKSLCVCLKVEFLFAKQIVFFSKRWICLMNSVIKFAPYNKLNKAVLNCLFDAMKK